jgi:AcrR family transcriptional regulator
MTVKPPPTRNFRGQSAEQRQAERRERLIQAGITSFGERGYHGVTVREVCAEAKLTERYFYESFENMQALFMEVFAKVSLAMKQEWLRALAVSPRDPSSLVEAFLRAFLKFISEDPRRARIVLYESRTVGENMLQFAEHTVDDYANTMRGFILLLFPDAATSGFNIDFLAHALVGANSYMAGRWMRENFKTPLEEVLQSHLQIYQALIEHAAVFKKAPAAVATESTKRAMRAKINPRSRS